MTKIDIFSGFLGAGKTTLIKKLIAEAYTGEKIVLIENEFGEIAIDGGFLKDSGVQINEMNSGCICCSLVGDFADALQKVLTQFHPDRILIEPSGVGKLSDVIRAVQGVQSDELVLNGFTTVVDANKCRMYMKNFGEFFNNQVENASAIILSRTEGIRPEKLDAAVALLREKNPTATIVTTPWTELDVKQILETMERRDTLSAELEHLKAEAAEDDDEDEHEHHHHHHDDDEHECCCGHHHHHDDDDDDDDDEHEHEHHHHHHDHEHDEHEHEHEHDHEEHEHHHEHDEHCTCGCHDHDHEHEHHHDHDHEHHHHDHDGHCCCGHDHDHDADEVFTSWGKETTHKYTEAELNAALTALGDVTLGTVLRAKGIVPAADGGEWLHFDYVPGAPEIRRGAADYTGRLCVIGSELDEERIAALFGVNEK